MNPAHQFSIVLIVSTVLTFVLVKRTSPLKAVAILAGVLALVLIAAYYNLPAKVGNEALTRELSSPRISQNENPGPRLVRGFTFVALS